jgi:hypothetical protein
VSRKYTLALVSSLLSAVANSCTKIPVRLVARFSDDAVRAVVAKARYSEPGAADHIVNTLIKRRDKVVRAWLTAVNPVTEPTISEDGRLTFLNAAINAGVASPMASYVLQWSRMDNATGAAEGQTVQQTVESGAGSVSTQAPPAILSGAPFVQVEIVTTHPEFSAWRAPVTLTFRREAGGWRHVGLERGGLGAGKPGNTSR